MQRAGAVGYLSGTDIEQIEQAQTRIEQAFVLFTERKEADQRALMNGRQKGGDRHHVYLILSEWFVLYAQMKRCRMLEPGLGMVSELVAKGAELNCHVWLDTQSHQVSEAGFTTTLKECFVFTVLGRNHPDVGFGLISRAIGGQVSLISQQTEKQRLEAALNGAIQLCGNSDRRVAMTLLGSPKICLLPDLKWLDEVSIVPEGVAPLGTPSTNGKRPHNESLASSAECQGDATPPDLEAFKPLFRAVTLALELGASETVIVKRVLGCSGGRTYETGKQQLAELLALGRDEMW